MSENLPRETPSQPEQQAEIERRERKNRRDRRRRQSQIDGRRAPGLRALRWRRHALACKGGKACPIDIRERIEGATFLLWKALELRQEIVRDARERKRLTNGRTQKLSALHYQYEQAYCQWERINSELQLDRPGIDLATLLSRQQEPKR
jgi:hypothetical protein